MVVTGCRTIVADGTPGHPERIMSDDLRILILEDVPTDAELMEREMCRAGLAFTSRRVETRDTFLEQLENFSPDIILADSMLLQFDGTTALQLAKERFPSIPFIILAGSMNEETAVECVKAGAADYVTKEHLIRMGPVIRAALENQRIKEEKERVEKVLGNAARQWKATFDAIGEAVSLLDLDGKILRCNVAMRNLLGKPWNEIVGRPCWELMHGTSGPVEGCPFMRMRETRQRESKAMSLNGRWFNAAVDPVLDEADNLIGAVHILFDITERKQSGEALLRSEEHCRTLTERNRAEDALRKSEYRYRTLVENLPQKVFLKDTNSVYVSCNGNYARDLKINPDEIAGKTDCDFYPTELAEKYRADDKRIMKSGKTEDLEERYIQDGHERRVHTVKTPVRDESGNVTGILGIFWDITDHRSLEEQLRQAQKMEAVGRLAGGIAHDFNNLLTVISGNAELAANTPQLSEDAQRFLSEVTQATDRAANLTRQLLAFSRLQPLEPRVVNLNEVLSNMGKMLRRLIHENIELAIRPAEDLWAVRVDIGQMEQVVVNLVINSRDAMSNGGRLVLETANASLDEEYARSHSDVTPGQYVMLAVSDTGVGMTNEVKERIFEPFYTTKELGQGTGLGLPTCYGVIKQSGGHIWVYSEPGKGTRFKIYLPRVEKEPGTLPQREETSERLLWGSETILLVEDDPFVRAVASRVLRDQGYTVLEASNGKEALRIVRKPPGRTIHLVLTDVVMPQMGGKELSRRLKALQPSIKVLFASGYTDTAIVRNSGIEPGFVLLQKPFTKISLARKVREVLDS
jgi:PAS domain S-box-containing protein